MKSTIPFDTHQFVKKLGAAGVPESQAEVLAEAWGEIVIEKLPTKEDLLSVEERLGHKIKEMESRLELRLTLRFGAMLAASVAVIAVLVKLL